MGEKRKRSRKKRVRNRAVWFGALFFLLTMSTYVVQTRQSGDACLLHVTAPFQPQYSANTNPQSSIDLVREITGMESFCSCYSVSGSGQKIALIDSGLDVSHAAFCRLDSGAPKVAEYYDYTEEGTVYTTPVQQSGAYISYGNTLYHVGGIYNAADSFCMGFLELDSLCPQVHSLSEEKVAILVCAVNGSYDCIYVDCNQNCDFTDEQPMYVYTNGGGMLFLPNDAYRMAVVVSSVSENGKRVQFSTDTLGHGTFLAGVIAANGDMYRGLAPNAQLCIYKIFDRKGESSQQKLALAIEQAVQDGVNCINLSLCIPKNEPIAASLKKALQSAEKANIPIIAAVGNYGPGTDTIAYPARESSVIAVGSCAYPQQYLLDRAVFLEEAFVPEYSSRGSLDAVFAPFLLAPSGVISTVPSWYQREYLYDYGTSVSAAIVTAAVSHLQECLQQSCNKEEKNDFSEQIKAQLALWARPLPVPEYEQGYGALYMGDNIQQFGRLSLPKLQSTNPVVHSFSTAQSVGRNTATTTPTERYWIYDIMQGQTKRWHIQVPNDATLLELTALLDTQQCEAVYTNTIAMGRCRMYVYNPKGELADVTAYIGASYGNHLTAGETISIPHPQSGIWEIVIVSADNLSLYNHFTSSGMLYAKVV